MPDLLTHAGIGALLRIKATRSPVVWFIVGSCLPDIASRLPGLGMAAVSWQLKIDIPLAVMATTGLAHMPIPYLLLCLLIGMLVPLRHRRVVLVNIVLGGLLHLALDACQAHLGPGYMLLYPFTQARWELGLFDAEDSLLIAPVVAMVVLASYGARYWWQRRTGRADG